MKCCHVLLALLLTGDLVPWTATAQEKKDLGVQFAENPPMQVILKTPPAAAAIKETFEVREGFALVKTLDEFRAAIKKDNQKIRRSCGGPWKREYHHQNRAGDNGRLETKRLGSALDTPGERT